MLKRQLLVTVSTLALTGLASAADLPARMPVKAMPAPEIVQLWAGPYIGINGGAVWHRQESDTFASSGAIPYDIGRKFTATGGMVGGQVGYNWQSQNVVFGLEADLDWVGARKSHVATPFTFPVVYTTKLNWLSTVRGRLGWAAGRTLLFATGGLAVGGVKANWGFTGAPALSVVSNETRVGWTAGGGIEHVISPRMTVKAEALYVDLGKQSQLGPGSTYVSHFKNTAVIGRLGVNLKW
jgi:outer membrane immunogenic protein